MFSEYPLPDWLAPGTTLIAKLMVGVTALEQSELPVMARGDDGSWWQGAASLESSGRLAIRFTGASRDDEVYAVEALVQADDGYAGLPVETTETTPALASDLARGTLRGAAEFVEGLRNQSQVTIQDGVPVITREAPGLDVSILGSVGRLFAPPEGDDQQALVRVAQVPAGTAFTIVILQAAPAAPPSSP